MTINTNCLNGIVNLAYKASLDQIKNLTQADRKLLALSCEFFKDKVHEAQALSKLKNHEQDLEKLKQKLTQKSIHQPSNWLVSFFKFLGNKLHLRISSADLEHKIESTCVHINQLMDRCIEEKEKLKKIDVEYFDYIKELEKIKIEIEKEKEKYPSLNVDWVLKRREPIKGLRLEMKFHYNECMKIFLDMCDNLRKNGFDKASLDHIQKTIQGFYLIALCREEIREKYNEDPQTAPSFTQENIGMIMKEMPDYRFNGAPELLFYTFNLLKEQAIYQNQGIKNYIHDIKEKIAAFFTHAFNVNDLDFEARYRRIDSFLKGRFNARAHSYFDKTYN